MTVPEHRLTAFDQVAVAQPRALLDAVMRYRVEGSIFGQSTSGGGAIAHVAAQSAAALTVGGTTGDLAKLRTHEHLRYQAGRGMRGVMSCYHTDDGQTNQVRRWGFFNGTDGAYFRLTGTTLAAVRGSGSGPGESAIDKAAWNVDRLDGSGGLLNPSKVSLDITKANTYEIRYAFGTGAIDFFVNGVHVHSMLHANTIAFPFMTTGELPMSFEVENTGASLAGGLTVIAAAAWAEGGDMHPGQVFAASNTKALSAGDLPILSVRPAATFNSIAFRGKLVPTKLRASASVLATVKLVMNATLGGTPSWSAVNAESAAEEDTAGASITGGEVLAAFTVHASAMVEIDLADIFGRLKRQLLLRYPADTQDALTVTINAASGNGYAALGWDEIR